MHIEHVELSARSFQHPACSCHGACGAVSIHPLLSIRYTEDAEKRMLMLHMRIADA
jgi:hypothetical protein